MTETPARETCQLCGAIILPGQSVCRYCGTRQTGGAPKDRKPRRNLISQYFFQIIIALPVLAGLAMMVMVFPAPYMVGPGKRLFLILAILLITSALVIMVDSKKIGIGGGEENPEVTPVKLFFSTLLAWFSTMPQYVRVRARLMDQPHESQFKIAAGAVGGVLIIALISLGFVVSEHIKYNRSQATAKAIMDRIIKDMAVPPPTDKVP